ncbi:hypothetical protein BT96DRAFT_929373 [Gymnopus androsaceus JB14]|uniref:Uncharacterized protein n=1 Tax=Gymnopus androsaceus JB14 TaxID=1447944 RepID=A0A6A4GFQ8_9AGAR|nr:hypothetical protein BT96DRAFT_929373 [Gymnopus androsaceus JB14]
MEERLVPILFRMQVEQDEKRALQEKVKAWRPKILQVESSASEVAQLKKELEKAERSKQAMARENARLKKELEKAERSKQAMARENARLKEELEKAERSKQAETKESEKLRRDVIDERRLVKKQDILIDQLVQEKKNADMQVRISLPIYMFLMLKIKQVNLAKKKLKVLAQSSSNRKA